MQEKYIKLVLGVAWATLGSLVREETKTSKLKVKYEEKMTRTHTHKERERERMFWTKCKKR